MNLQNFTPISALVGGALIGVSATLLLALHGRIAGISGIIGGAIEPDVQPAERSWRSVFLLGLVAAGYVLSIAMPGRFELGTSRSPALIVLAGVLVGVGTRLGSGCTSGHGICGISRGSPRSLVATITFMSAGVLTVLAYRVFGGAP